MKIGLIGRTSLLLETGKLLHQTGFDIGFVITSKEAPEYDVKSTDFKDFAREMNCSFLHDPSIDRKKIKELIAEQNIPLVISINYSGVISEEVTDLFPLGILNAHGGDLPRYRGNACQAWAIINGENQIGLCIHRMVGGELDSGDILDRKYYPISLNTRIGEIYQRFEGDIPQMFLKVVNKLKVDSEFVLESQSKDSKDALRCYPRRPEDGRIDWKDHAKVIVRLINASSEPFNGAYCYDQKGQKVTIWRAVVHPCDENYLAVPGQISSIDSISGNMVLITGNGKILVEQIEVVGKRMKPSEFFKSIRSRLI
jgi:UDP-4-amino-4-deoxy-L-arabinose formyltransferase/UDP-glucuronic acid dehydrogenase (UDP-4-keto-hexauronic acid decarboxylating)